ncbi:MAG: hypothetical protein L6Q37_11190 [Bdellovibrionaceae bacterium]|nr:hypothetical protein [Pseudobdellovibrionaceae bacterium]NUM60388.1 hypothetical protein [Pseudobdellovibrionaceae bacterium]
MKNKIKNFIQRNVKHLQEYANKWWYSPLIALLAAADNLVVIVPTDGILISSTMMHPKKWIQNAFAISIGSSIGAMILAAIVEIHGLPWILEFYPQINQNSTWTTTEVFFNQYGLLLVFAIAITPLMQQPTIILAALANTSLWKLALVVFTGRFLKYLIMSYIASHAPKLLTKLWGVQEELEEVGITDNKI